LYKKEGIMTLQELFKSVQFEDMTEYLINIDSQAADNLYAFKEAFDILCMMEAKEGSCLPISIERVIDELDEVPFLSVYFKRWDNWECMLSRPIEVNEHTETTTSEIAAAILWELTFYGFSPEEEIERLTWSEQIEETNPYKEQYLKIEQRHHDINCRYKSDIGTSIYTYKGKSDMFWKPRRNGPKRHREKRLSQRVAALGKKMRRWELYFRLKFLSKLDSGIADMLLDAIMKGSDFYHYYMESRTKDGNDIEYITDLIRDYFPHKQGSKSIVLVTAPKKLCDSEDLRYSIWSAFGSFRKIPSPKYIFSPNDDRRNIRIDILVFD